MIRRLLEEAAELVRRSYEPSQVLLIEAPTGYGKSTSVPVLAEGLYENEYAFNFIHVLPLRAIVSDLYRKMYLRSFDGGAGKPLLRVREALERMGIGKDDVAYQMGMDALLKEVGGRKSPSFDARAVVSTLDSFAYNLLRVPVSDSFRATKRYAIVRARIFTSAVFFDEAHMILRYPDDEDAGRELAFMKALTEYARAARVPLIVSSATIGSWFEGKVREGSQEHGRIVKLGPRDEGGPGAPPSRSGTRTTRRRLRPSSG